MGIVTQKRKTLCYVQIAEEEEGNVYELLECRRRERVAQVTVNKPTTRAEPHTIVILPAPQPALFSPPPQTAK